MSTASKIIAQDLTPKERMQKAEFIADSFDWPSADKNGISVISYAFKDGSNLVVSLDTYFNVIEIIEV